jgi:hypothetical protein
VDLQTYQRKLAGLIRGTESVDDSDDGHFRSLADSVNLRVAQEIILEWRSLRIENYCRLTAAALKQLGVFSSRVGSFLDSRVVSPYAEELGSDFLAEIETHSDDFIAAIAEFERALIDVQQGLRDTVTLQWRHDPYAVLDAIMTGSGLSHVREDGRYEIRVARDMDGLFQVVEL